MDTMAAMAQLGSTREAETKYETKSAKMNVQQAIQSASQAKPMAILAYDDKRGGEEHNTSFESMILRFCRLA